VDGGGGGVVGDGDDEESEEEGDWRVGLCGFEGEDCREVAAAGWEWVSG
jgi:hypothetical protein